MTGPSENRSALHLFACVTAGGAFVLLFAGGMVTSTGSSLAVPDWPLAFGQYFPRMTGGVLFEHGHRMIAGTVAVLTMILVAWIWLEDRRLWARLLAAGAALGILLQAGLGAVTVLYSLPRHMHRVSIAHAVLGQTVFCLLLCLAQATSPWFLEESEAPSRNPSPSKRGEGVSAETASTLPVGWASLAVAFVYIQLFFGAMLRHTGKYALVHVAMALIVAGVVLWASIQTTLRRPQQSALTRPATLLMILLPLQIVLGVVAYAIRFGSRTPMAVGPAALRTSHLACGAAILGTCVVLTLRLWHEQPSAWKRSFWLSFLHAVIPAQAGVQTETIHPGEAGLSSSQRKPSSERILPGRGVVQTGGNP